MSIFRFSGDVLESRITTGQRGNLESTNYGMISASRKLVTFETQRRSDRDVMCDVRRWLIMRTRFRLRPGDSAERFGLFFSRGSFYRYSKSGGWRWRAAQTRRMIASLHGAHTHRI